MIQGGSRRAAVLLVAGLFGSGCLRFAYNDVDRQRGATHDAGMDGGQGQPSDGGGTQMDAQPSAAGRGGSGGRTQSSGGSTAGRAASGGGGQSGSQAGDAGAFDASAQADASVAGDSGAGVVDAGGGSDAGVDAGSVDAGPPLPCEQRPGVLFCNGFETGSFTGWNYQLWDNGSATLSTTIKHGGEGAAHATTGSPQPVTRVRFTTAALGTQTSGNIWARYFYYLPSTTKITWWFSSGAMSEISEPWQGFDLLIHENYVEIESMLGYFNKGIPFPRDRWVCVELRAYIHASQGYFEAYLDGVNVATSDPGDTLPAGGYNVADFGLHYVDPRQDEVEIYVDDAAVGTQRIGCN